MTDLAVIKATFCDFKIVKGRKQAQLVFEVPLEQAQDAITRLGMPMPSNPVWCAIALLNPDAPTPAMEDAAKLHKSEVAKQRYASLPEWQKATTRAAMLPKDKQFQRWVINEKHFHFAGPSDEELAAKYIRIVCGVESRSEISTDEGAYKAFVSLETEFRQAVGQAAEFRG